MKTLALEFSSARRSVATWDSATGQGRQVVIEDPQGGGRSTQVFAMIDEALRASGWEREAIERIAVGLGPGSYTGIRVAIAVAQGWGLALPVSRTGISSAEALAVARLTGPDRRAGSMTLAIDAQRQELYLASWGYENGTVRETDPLRLATRAEAEARVQAGEWVVGPGASALVAGAQDAYPEATWVAQLAAMRAEVGGSLEPIYLRPVSFVKAPPPRWGIER